MIHINEALKNDFLLRMYYVFSGDLAYFDGLAEVIVAVELVHVKPGVFKDEIKYLLTLATPMEILMIGVQFRQPPGKLTTNCWLRFYIGFMYLLTFGNDYLE